jgi:hypothetical protein
VRLEQLALLAFEAVLGLGQVAELGVGLAGLEQLGLLLPQLEALTDQRGLVGVEDPPVACPQLHAHDRLAEDLALHDPVEAGQRLLVAAQHVVGEPRLLDQPALDPDALARVALGLLRGHRAHDEEPADHDHGDRREAADHEPGDGRRDPWRCAGRHRHVDTTVVALRFGRLRSPARAAPPGP